MKLITRDTDYAVRALCFIARHNKEVVAVNRLTRELGIPRPFLRKILQALNRSGVLKSYKGKGGGFRLGRKPAKIYLTDLIQVFQGPLKLSECFFKKRICPDRAVCRLRREITSAEQYLVDKLKAVTIKSLLDTSYRESAKLKTQSAKPKSRTQNRNSKKKFKL